MVKVLKGLVVPIVEANWMGTNRFHQFCLNKLNSILETGLSLEELQKRLPLQFVF